MSRARPRRQRERGVSLVVAVFLLVVLAGLAAYAVRLSLLQRATVSSGLLSAQAFYAARSGLAWGAHRATSDGWCATASLALGEGGLTGFRVDVSCTETSHAEGGAAIEVYVIEALAESGSYGSPGYVSRRLEAKIMDQS